MRGNLEQRKLDWVYPRACGGTGIGTWSGSILPESGLSPRVRGNQTSLPPSRDPEVRVYPRACGETLSSALNPP